METPSAEDLAVRRKRAETVYSLLNDWSRGFIWEVPHETFLEAALFSAFPETFDGPPPLTTALFKQMVDARDRPGSYLNHLAEKFFLNVYETLNSELTAAAETVPHLQQYAAKAA